MEETFTYDDMNRLTGITLKRPSGQDLYCSATYDALGRMTSKEAVTKVNSVPQVTTVFSLPVFDNTKVHALSQAQTSEGVFLSTDQTVTYTGFDKVSKVKQGNDSICYSYGYDRQRISMEEHVGNTTRTKRYVGNCEYVTETTGGYTETQWLTYLSGPTGVFAVMAMEGGNAKIHYILKDNLGSWTTITDEEGSVEQNLSYDAWGNLRNPNTWTNYTASDSFDKPMFDRGFTGHEHLAAFGLVNMNGRMYDPVTSTFLSVDNFVQDPSSTQSFNRYAYCMNNPLKYVDPDGEFPWVSMLIGAGISVVTNGIDNILKDKPFFDGAGKAALYGGLQGLASFGIGQLASGISSVGSRVAFQTLAHGSLGGVSSTLNGGNFTQGFVSGAIGSLVATGMGGLTQDWGKWGRGIGVIGGGALAGGVSSSISGGRFWDGFRNGAISAGLNHAVHTGVFGRGVMMASITGRTRHLFGPDAIARAVTADISVGEAFGGEVGSVEILVGKDKGFHYYKDLGVGAGVPTASFGVEVVDMYSSSSLSEVSIDDFSGPRWEINGSLTAYGFGIGITGVLSEHYDESGMNPKGFTIGVGRSINVDAVACKASFNINYGISDVDNSYNWKNYIRGPLTIKKL